MFKWIFSYLGKKEKPRITMNHADLGMLVFDESEGTWESGDSGFYYGGIAGTKDGPDDKDIAFIVKTTTEDIILYWKIGEPFLIEILANYENIEKNKPINEIFKLSAISLYSDYWELCFETNPQYKWLYIGLQFRGQNVVSTTIDT